MSASQLDTFSQCMAKWGFQYLDGHQPPPHPSAQCGTRVHEILEGWLRSATPPNPDEVLVIKDRVYEVGKIAMAGLHNLPSPGPHHDVEGEFTIPFMSGYPANWRGYIDSSYTVRASADGTEVEVVPEILDHKTTTNLDYRKTADDLLTDVQAMLYAWVGLTRVPTANRVNLRWVYYKTSKPYRSEVTYTTVTREHVEKILGAWEELAVAGPLRARALGYTGSQLPKNPRTCGRYGGCPHKDVRCRLTREERIDATMSSAPDLLALIQNAKASLAQQPPAPPLPAETATAPLLAPPPPPPAPPAPPVLPSPWVLSQDPTWAYNPQTGEFRPAVQLVAPAPPVAAPPPPPAPPAPHPAQTGLPGFLPPVAAPVVVQAAPPPPPAPPAPPAATIPSVTTEWPDEVRKNVIAGIRAGATDEQIVAYYPPAADRLVQLRKDLVLIDEYTARAAQKAAEPAAPQRATGINAPESATLPLLAEPAVEAPASADAAVDPSKQGDAFDALDVEGLRTLAKQHGIDVKGLREKNLRITVRNELKNRGIAAPSASPAAPPPPPPPAPLAATAQLPAPPPPASAVLTGAQAQAVREALDALNRVGDALRKLIGAD